MRTMRYLILLDSLVIVLVLFRVLGTRAEEGKSIGIASTPAVYPSNSLVPHFVLRPRRQVIKMSELTSWALGVQDMLNSRFSVKPSDDMFSDDPIEEIRWAHTRFERMREPSVLMNETRNETNENQKSRNYPHSSKYELSRLVRDMPFWP